jgi:hypothetical protein
MDWIGGKVELIRRPEGRIPRGMPVDLVYNATPSFLSRFEFIDPAELASFIGDQFKQSESCTRDGGEIEGLQLDLDIPTRLLPRYETMLARLHARLSAEARLSITGLPTWMESSDLRRVLMAVDFWIPQAYGARIAERADECVPIASIGQVIATAVGARSLGRPFYIGLPAYSYTALYSVAGNLIGLRGDIAPEDIAASNDFELIHRNAVTLGSELQCDAALCSGGWKYDFRARADTVIGGLTVHSGETLVLSTMTSAGLRACARAVRERAGSKLLGLCLFRLPCESDKSTLSIQQIAAALADQDEGPLEFDLETTTTSDPRQVALQLTNPSGISSIIGRDAIQVELDVPAGSLRAVDGLEGFASFESTWSTGTHSDEGQGALSSVRRASRIRLWAPYLPPGAGLRASLEFQGAVPQNIPLTIRVRADDGRVLVEKRELMIRDNDATKVMN